MARPFHAARDANGKVLRKNVKQEDDDLWGCNVWFGGHTGVATEVRRYIYATRAQASKADISDDIGARGRIA